jgi:hypothetical protein
MSTTYSDRSASPVNAALSTLGPVRSTTTRLGGPLSVEGDRAPSAYSRVLATAKESGLMRRAPGFYSIVFGSLVLATAGVVYGFIVLGDTWYQLLIAAALGVVLTQFAFLTHEASHRQVFTSGKLNDRVGRLLAAGVVGISYAWWMNKHTRHHQHPNTMGKDPDIAIDTISFTEEDARTRTGFAAWITRRQGYLFFPLLTLEGLNLHLRSTMGLFERRPIQGRALELTLIFVRLGAYVAVVFWLLPVGMAFAFIGVQMAVFGIYMGASFAPNHKGMPLISAGMKIDFFRRPETGLGLFIPFPNIMVFDRKNYKAIFIFFKNRFNERHNSGFLIILQQLHAINWPYICILSRSNISLIAFSVVIIITPITWFIL